MKRVRNLSEVLQTLSLSLYGREWSFSPLRTGYDENHQQGRYCYFIADESLFDGGKGGPNVFGITIDFKERRLTLHIIRKGTGWRSLRDWTLAEGDRFDEALSTRDRFLHHLRVLLPGKRIEEALKQL